ncbi:hypothetical protein DdX_09584 [Ditylenchus destructor]|uniref:Uncharacterized protein n=1 Tax=Ditylenchus destructor TaxID=166010 RepID=A0AAD4N0Q8_9BILA|nr:hypothetical protein DdX_09584 [Ditylenchus destructor]
MALDKKKVVALYLLRRRLQCNCEGHSLPSQLSPGRHPRAMADYGLRNEDNGQWRRDIQPQQQATAVIRRRGGDVRGNSQEIRNKLTEYFSGIGAVGWQDNYL